MSGGYLIGPGKSPFDGTIAISAAMKHRHEWDECTDEIGLDLSAACKTLQRKQCDEAWQMIASNSEPFCVVHDYVHTHTAAGHVVTCKNCACYWKCDSAGRLTDSNGRLAVDTLKGLFT